MNLVKPIFQVSKIHPMTSESEKMEYVVPNPFGHMAVEEILTQIKPEVVEVRCDMVIPNAKTQKMN